MFNKKKMIITVVSLLSIGVGVTYCLAGDIDIEKLFFNKKAAAPVVSAPIVENDNQPQKRVNKDLPELILVNKSIRLDKKHEPNDLTSVQGVYLREMASVALKQMLSVAEREGVNGIVPYSGYRSYGTQAAVYSNKINSLRSKYGESAEEMAAKLVAPPGASEHQTGLAVDLTLKAFLEYEYVLNYEFADTTQGQWLRKNSWKYGFILRFDEDKEDKTAISYEPWHFRYVGLEHAKIIYERNVCLEEYLN